MSKREYRENSDGVHLMYGEFTVCGDSFDIFETEEDIEEGPLVETKKRVVTCPKCVAHIEHCRGVHIALTRPLRADEPAVTSHQRNRGDTQ